MPPTHPGQPEREQHREADAQRPAPGEHHASSERSPQRHDLHDQHGHRDRPADGQVQRGDDQRGRHGRERHRDRDHRSGDARLTRRHAARLGRRAGDGQLDEGREDRERDDRSEDRGPVLERAREGAAPRVCLGLRREEQRRDRRHEHERTGERHHGEGAAQRGQRRIGQQSRQRGRGARGSCAAPSAARRRSSVWLPAVIVYGSAMRVTMPSVRSDRASSGRARRR